MNQPTSFPRHAAAASDAVRMPDFDHEYPFDPTYGYDFESLLRVPAPPPPDDFASFWQATFAEAAAMRPRVTAAPSPLSTDRVEVLEVEFSSLGGFRTGGWLTRPRGEHISRGVVVGHGYGGRDAPEAVPGRPPAAMLYLCARGFSRSAHPGLPATAQKHVVHGIESRDRYIIRFCVAEIWAAASALLELEPQVAGCLHYMGGSFGGGLGALALPWDTRFQRAALGVPTFGNQPLRLALPCVGSGNALTQLHRQRPDITRVLAYFDAATAARFIRIPVLCQCALFDPAVPPPGQFAVHNALGGKRELFITPAAHFTYPGQPQETLRHARRQAQWFTKEPRTK